MVRDALRGYLSLAGGLAEDLVTSSRRNRENFTLIARHEVEQTIRRFGVGAAVDVDALTQRIRRLERTVRELQAELARAQQNSNAQPTKKTTARKAAAKKSTPKKA